MEGKKELKINKKHGGKEFKSTFHFVGLVKPHIKGIGDKAQAMPLYTEKETINGNLKRDVQFDIYTSEFNNIKVATWGMEQEYVYPYSSVDKKSVEIKWNDRDNKSKYPNDSYHLILPPWDIAKAINDNVEFDKWIEVKGHYEFGKYTNDEGKEYPTIKRIIDSFDLVEDGQEIKIGKNKTINYICDFKASDFQEINRFDLEIGIKSTYENEDNIIINGVFLAYGKEASVPQDIKLTVFKERDEKLAKGFTKMNRGDYIKVIGVDNNRPEFSLIPKTNIDDDDPFADLENQEEEYKYAISGNKKGLEIVRIVKGSFSKGMLSEEELEINEVPFIDTEDPFQ